MFTGIVEEVGTVEAIKKAKLSSVLTIKGRAILGDLKLGDSVAVDGVCLTVSTKTPNGFSADVMRETLDRTTLGKLSTGSRVNLERALSAQGRFGGHIVSGHIDGCGSVTRIQREDNAVWYTIRAHETLLRYIVLKGSIALDGISLTVARLSSHDFSVSLIPHTLKVTALSYKKVGDQVNLENDLIGKYVERLLEHPAKVPTDTTHVGSSGFSAITREFLAANGF